MRKRTSTTQDIATALMCSVAAALPMHAHAQSGAEILRVITGVLDGVASQANPRQPAPNPGQMQPRVPIPLLQTQPRYATMQSLLHAVTRGELAQITPNSDDAEITASIWATLNELQPLPGSITDHSQAFMFNSMLMTTISSINQATWGKLSPQPPAFGAALITFSDYQVRQLVQQNIHDPFVLNFCGTAYRQCSSQIEQWLQAVAQASVAGARQEQQNRAESWQAQEQARIAQEQQHRQAEQARAQAARDAENSAIAERARRIREQELQRQEQRSSRVGG